MNATPPSRRPVTPPTRPPASNVEPATGPSAPPERIAAALATTWLEIRSGRRPVAQLLPYVAPAVRRRLVAQLPSAARLSDGTGMRVHRVVTTYPTSDACEATVLIAQQGRITALAIRLERRRQRWAAVELTAPEAGLSPLRPPTHRPMRFDPDRDEDEAEPLTG